MVDGDIHHDINGLSRLIGGLYSRRIGIIMSSIRSSILNFATNTAASERGLVDVVVQGCSFVKTPEKPVVVGMSITRSKNETPNVGVRKGD